MIQRKFHLIIFFLHIIHNIKNKKKIESITIIYSEWYRLINDKIFELLF